MATAQPEITKTLRYGIESVRGTSVPCTGILDISDVDWDILPAQIRSDNLTGGVFPSNVLAAGVIISRVRAKLGSINPDKWQKWLASGVDGSIASAGAGADKTWGTNTIHPPALSTGGALTESLKSFTLEFGYANPSATQPAHKITGAIVERIKLIWPRIGFVQGEIDFVSISAVTDLTAYSGTLSPDAAPTWVPSMNDSANPFRCYIDAATIGTTQDTTIVGAELEWKSFMAPDENGKRLSIAKATELAVKLTRFHEAADMLAAVRTQGLQKIRIDSVGPTLGAGTWILGADVYGAASTRSLASLSGFVSEEIEITSKRDATAGTDVNFRLVNSVATI